MKNTWKHMAAVLLSAAVLVALDQWTKLLAVAQLKDQPAIVLLDGVLEFQYLENHGAAFGILQGQQLPLVIFTVFLAAAIIYFYLRTPEGRRYVPMRLMMVAILAGAAGNFIDRCRLNYVIDFIYFKLIDFPIFNVADCYVTVSVIAFALLILFYYREEELDFLFHPLKKKQKLS